MADTQLQSTKFSYVPNKYHGANNVYFKTGCPAIMNDARFLTNYNSANELTEQMRRVNGFKSANQFRTFMQNNGNLFMNADRNFQLYNNTCAPAVACSEGWYNLWTDDNGNWANEMQK